MNITRTLTLTTFLAGASLSQGATLIGSSEVISVTQDDANFNVSVNASEAGYSGSEASGSFGTVLDYAFVNGGTTVFSAGAATIVGTISPNNVPVSSGGNRDWMNLWDASDPNGFADPATADYDARDAFGNANTGVSGNVTGTIDLSGLTSGSVYVIHGTFNDDHQVFGTMSGSGQTDINAQGTLATIALAGNQSHTWITKFDFETDGLYDTLDFTYQNNDVDGSRAAFFGVVVTAVPEPSSSALLGLGFTSLLLRRRR